DTAAPLPGAHGHPAALDEFARRSPRLKAELRAQFEVDQALSAEELAGPPVSPPGSTAPAPHRPAAPPEEAGWLHGCELLEEVGRGAMGTVWRAWQTAAHRLVAVKVLSADVPAGRARTEIEAATRLSHPNILTVYEVREEAGRTALILEYVEGGNLAAKLAGKPQPAADAARLAQTLAWAMAHAH